MSQLTFAEAEYAHKKKRTRREEFLEKMDALIPWQKLERKLAKGYPRGKTGRPLSVINNAACAHDAVVL